MAPLVPPDGTYFYLAQLGPLKNSSGWLDYFIYFLRSSSPSDSQDHKKNAIERV
jgi:hypothetical protein